MDRPLPASMASCTQSAFRIELSLSVTDASALWNAALARGLGAADANRDELIELIGPAEDPDVPACLSMLVLPSAIAGCELDDFELVELCAAASPAPANDLVLQKRFGASA